MLYKCPSKWRPEERIEKLTQIEEKIGKREKEEAKEGSG